MMGSALPLSLKYAAKKNPAGAGFFVPAYPMRSCLGGRNIGCLESFRTFFYLIVNRLAFDQCFETRALNRIAMHEYVVAASILSNKNQSLWIR